jgi:hypothetical protein
LANRWFAHIALKSGDCMALHKFQAVFAARRQLGRNLAVLAPYFCSRSHNVFPAVMPNNRV